MDKLLSPFKQSGLLNTVFKANVFLSLHYALTLYINSSYLSNFFNETQVSSLYIIGSLASTACLIYASKILEKLGIYRFTIYAVFLEFLATLGMAVSTTPFLVAVYFMTYMTVITLLLFSLDVLAEETTTNTEIMGGVRATFLTITNATIVAAPLLVSLLVRGENYTWVYLLATVVIMPMYWLINTFKSIEIGNMEHISIKDTLSVYVKNTDLYNVFISHLLLQLFYAFMIVYTPIYLNHYIGFSWGEIGLMFTIMLLPFVLFEVPVGELSDEKYGEVEFLTIGFVVMGLATLFMSFITLKSFWIWATVLFITRIGASFVEISSESYFFKKVKREETDVISFFRVSRPLSFIMAPVIATLVLQFIPFQYIFIVIGSLMIVGTHYSLALKDTK